MVDKPLSATSLPAGVVVGAIIRGADVILPQGDTVIQAGDRVVSLALRDNVSDVEKMFRVAVEYF